MFGSQIGWDEGAPCVVGAADLQNIPLLRVRRKLSSSRLDAALHPRRRCIAEGALHLDEEIEGTIAHIRI